MCALTVFSSEGRLLSCDTSDVNHVTLSLCDDDDDDGDGDDDGGDNGNDTYTLGERSL